MRIIVPALHTIEIAAAKRLRPEQKTSFQLRELVFRFSQPEDLVVELFAGTFLAKVLYFTVSCHPVFSGVRAVFYSVPFVKRRFLGTVLESCFHCRQGPEPLRGGGLGS